MEAVIQATTVEKEGHNSVWTQYKGKREEKGGDVLTLG